MKRIASIFYNQEEKRLRALWRITVHTLAVSAFTTAFTLGLMVVMLIGDAILGTGLAQSLLRGDTVNLSQVPLVLRVVVCCWGPSWWENSSIGGHSRILDCGSLVPGGPIWLSVWHWVLG